MDYTLFVCATISSMNQLLVQGIGFLALFLVILSFQKKQRSTILLIMLSGLILFVIHFSLLNAWTGAMMNLIEAGMVFVAYKKEAEVWAQHKHWPYVFILLFVLVGLYTSQAAVDILPVIAQSFGALAVWQTKSRSIRSIMLIPRPLWFIYNFTVGSYAGMVAEVFILTSVVTGIMRFDVFGREKEG